MALGQFLNDYFRAMVPRQTSEQDQQAMMAALFSGTPGDSVNVTPQVQPQMQQQLMMPSPQGPMPGGGVSPPMPGQGAPMAANPLNPSNLSPTDQVAQRKAAGAYNDTSIAPLMQGPQAEQLKALLGGLSPQTAMPFITGLLKNQILPKAPIVTHEGDTLISPTTLKPLYTAPPKGLTPNERAVQTQNDYNALDQGSNDIAKAMSPSDIGLGSSAPGLSWGQRQKAFADEQLKKNNPNQPFNDDGTPNKAYQDYKIKEAGSTAAARSAATNGTGVGQDGNAIGTIGTPDLDATTPGYASALVGSTGLTQASIDQKALTYITDGKLPPQGRTGMAGTQNAAISNRMGEMDPAGNLAAHGAQFRSLAQSLTQQQKYLDNTERALNTANDTLDALQEWMQKNGVNPSQFPDANRFYNYLKAKGFDPGMAGGYNAQLATLRAEYSQVLAKGGVRSVETDREAAKLIPDGLPPSAIAQVAERIRVDADNVVRDSHNQIAKVTGQINNVRTGKASPAYQPPPPSGAPAARMPDAAETKTINGVTYHKVGGQWMQ